MNISYFMKYEKKNLNISVIVPKKYNIFKKVAFYAPKLDEYPKVPFPYIINF